MNKPSISVITFDGPHTPPTLRRVPRPVVPPRGALVRIEACGVCGTDLHILRGHWPKPLPWPITLGHEVAGVIVEKGPGLERDYMGQALGVGSKVALPPLMPCGECYYCAVLDTPQKCINIRKYGH